MTDATLFSAFAGDRRLGGLAADPRPAFVWGVDGKLLWANAAGAGALGVTLADLAAGRTAAGAAALAPGIARIARALSGPAAVRIEKLRFPGLGRLEALACFCRLFDTPEGALLMTAQQVPRWARRAVATVPAAPPALPEMPPAPVATWRWVGDEEFVTVHPAAIVTPPEPEPVTAGIAASAANSGGVPAGETSPPALDAHPADGASAAVPQPSAEPVSPLAEEQGPPARDGDAAPVGETSPATPGVPPAEAAPAIPQARTGPVRFVFRTESDGRLAAVSPELAAAIGEAGARWPGRTFAEIATEAGLDADNAVSRAMAGRETWSGLSFDWPDPEAGVATPIELSALPIFDRSRAFQGFRGFGICRMPRPLPQALPGEPGSGPAAAAGDEDDVPRRADTESGDAADAAVLPAAPQEDGGRGHRLVEAWRGPQAGDPGAAERRLVPANDVVEARPPADAAPASPVIPLAAAREARGATADSNIVRLHQARPAASERPSLSPSERNAFREIARALGARVEGDDEPSKPSAVPGGGPGQAAADAPAALSGPVRPADAPSVPPTTAPSAGAPAPVSAQDHSAVPAATPLDDLPSAAGPAGPQQDSPASPPVGPEPDGAATPVAPLFDGPPPPEHPAAAPQQEAPVTPPPGPQAAPSAPTPAHAAGEADERLWAADADLAAPAGEGPLKAVRRHLVAEQEPLPEQPAPETDQSPESVPLGLVDRLPIGILVARGETLLFANRTLLDLTGHDDLEAMRASGGLEQLFAGPGPVDGPEEDMSGGVLLRRADGETVAVDGRVQTTPWNGENALLISIRRRAPAPAERSVPVQAAVASLDEARQAALAERRADELQAVLDTATDGVIILNADGVIIGVNRSAEALFGYEIEEIAGKSLALLLAPDSHRAAFDYLDSLRQNGVASVLNDGREVTGRVRQGGLVPLYMTLGRLGEADGNRFCAVLRDMTSFKKTEAELLDARRRAEDASSHKSDFLARISHEIRTPLNAIVGFAELMMEERFGPLGNDRYRAYARDIHASGSHVISLVDDLLDLSKIEAGRLELTFASVDLNEILQQAVAIMQPQANGGRIIIRTALAPGLPNIVADSRSLRQIALNLLSNSVKFTPPAGQIIVSTTLSERGEAVLRVRDTGEGMTDKELAIALEPFRQVATASVRGTGLGLPLTKALVEANRATFAIQSAKNAGTIVEVVFPPMRVLAE